MNSFLHVKKICGVFLFTLLIFVFKNAEAQVPVITTNPTDQTVCGGNDAVFQVVATNNPVSYIWQYSYTTITPITWNNLIDNATYVGSATAALTVHTTNEFIYSAYQYRCLATNGSGSSLPSSNAILLVEILPSNNFLFPSTASVC